MTANDLKSEFGRSIRDIELAKYLGFDVWPVRKYATRLGGVMVTPGKYWCAEKVIKKQFKNAAPNHQKRCAPVSGKCSYSGNTRQKETKALYGRQQKITQKSDLMGGKTKKKLIEEMEQEAVTVFFNLGNGKGLNCLQAFLRHKNATATEKYLKSLGLKPLREGLDEGFKRPGKVIELKKLKAPGTISHGG